MSTRPTDLVFMRPHAEDEDAVVLVVQREIRGGLAEAVHPYPAWFLHQRYAQDPRWAWKTLSDMHRRLGAGLDRFETDPRRLFPGRAA